VFTFKLPTIDLSHLVTLTDETGILHHTKFSIPERREGYTTDDNARALIACIKYLSLFTDFEIEKLVGVYLSFLLFMQKPDGRLHNLLAYDRTPIDENGSEDSMGRSLMACGHAINSNISKEKRLLTKQIFDNLSPWSSKFKSPRSKAFAIIGLNQYRKALPDDLNVLPNMRKLAQHLVEDYKSYASLNWDWFEPYLTYENAKLSQAMIDMFDASKNREYLQLARRTFDFLIKVQIKNGIFFPIGNRGWYKKGGKRAFYDQQPIEASSMVEAAVQGFKLTGEENYRKVAKIAFDWYLGNNTKTVAVYNEESGACYDGITPEGLNLNQGAESIITYLIARLELETMFRKS